MDFDHETLENECFIFSDKKDHDTEVVSVNTYALSQWIMRIVPIKCVVETKEILTYFHGKYVPNGNEFIHRILVNALAPYKKVGGTSVYNKHLFEEVIHVIRGLTYAHAASFDADLDWINLENGMLNWRTEEFRPHDPDRDLSRIQIPVKYDPYAICPSIMKIFKTVLKEEDYVKALEFIAYTLYRAYPIQKVFIMIGPGGTGKTHFLDIITTFLGGENCSSVSMHDLERDRFASSDLYNALLNGFGDMEQSDLPNVNILKMLTSDKDRIRAQKKGRQAFEFVNFAKLMFGTNKLAKVKDDTSGFFRRVELLPFDHIFTPEEKDPELLRKSLEPEEMSGLLNLVLPYLAPLIERGEFTNAFDVEKAEARYKVASDPMSTFVENFIVEDPEKFIPKEDLYISYVAFCKKHGVKPPSCSIWFGREFAKVIPIKAASQRNINGRTKAVWLNLRLRTEEEVYAKPTILEEISDDNTSV